MGDKVLIKVAEAETKTRGGILLAESSQRKPTSGALRCCDATRIIIVHPQCVSCSHAFTAFLSSRAGDVMSFGSEVKGLTAGQTVVYNKFGIGISEISVQGEFMALIRESDLIGIFPNSGTRALSRMNSRVLLTFDAFSFSVSHDHITVCVSSSRHPFL